MNSSQKMQQGRDEQEIIALAAEQVRALLDRPILYSLVVKEKELDFQVCPQSETNKLIGAMTAEEVGVADWVVKITNTPEQLLIHYLTHRIYICPSEGIRKLWA